MDLQQQRSYPQNPPSARPTAGPRPIPTNASENQATPGSTASLQVTATTSSSAASLVPSFDCSTTDSSAGGDGADVQALREEAAQLQEQFVTILAHTKKVFFQKQTLWCKFKFELTSLRLSTTGCQQFLKKEHNHIMKATDADEMFDLLKPYWNYTDNAFLKYLIKKFGTKELKEEMKTYVAALDEFEKKASIQDFNSAVEGNRVLPAHFRTVTIALSKDPTEYSLHDVHQLKNEVVKQSTLHDYTVYLQAVKCSAVEVTLAYPPEAHTELLAVFNKEFMQTHNIATTKKQTQAYQWSRTKRKNVPGNSGTPPQHLPANQSMCRA